MSEKDLEKQLREAFELTWEEYPSGDLAAVDEITNLFGLSEPGDLVRYLRSDEEISRFFREALANAVETGRVRIVRGQGRPRSDRQRLLHRVAQIEIGRAVFGRMQQGELQKNAVKDVAEERNVSERTVREALKFIREEIARVKGRGA